MPQEPLLDWLSREAGAEATSYPRELAESALAHVLTNKVEAAYQRGDLFTKRTRLMQAWADSCDRSGRPGHPPELVRFRPGTYNVIHDIT